MLVNKYDLIPYYNMCHEKALSMCEKFMPMMKQIKESGNVELFNIMLVFIGITFAQYCVKLADVYLQVLKDLGICRQ